MKLLELSTGKIEVQTDTNNFTVDGTLSPRLTKDGVALFDVFNDSKISFNSDNVDEVEDVDGNIYNISSPLELYTACKLIFKETVGGGGSGNDYGNTVFKIEYWQEVDATTATTGTISFPTGATLDETILANIDNAYSSALDTSGNLEIRTPKDENGNFVYPSLDSGGNWNLDAANTTVADTFAIVFFVSVSLENYNAWSSTERSYIFGQDIIDVAEDIQLDNKGKNLSAENVQDGIDEKSSYQLDGTRIVSGAAFTVNADDNTTWDLAAGTAQIVDYTNRDAPTIHYLEWEAQTGLQATYLATADKTAIAITNDNTARSGISFDNSFAGLVNGVSATLYVAEKTDDNAIFTIEERNIYGYLGRLTHFSQTFLFSPNTLPDSGYALKSKFAALARAVMPYNDDGNTLSGNTTDTTRVDISAGIICSENVSVQDNPNNPDFISHTQESQVTLLSRYQTPTGREDGSSITAWDFSTYNDVTDAANPLQTAGNNNYLIPRIYRFPQTGNIIYLYGQKVYSSKETARLGIFNDSIQEDSDLTDNAVYLGNVIQRTNGSDTTDTADWEFVAVGNRFGGGSSSAAGLVTLQDATDATVDAGDNPFILLPDITDGDLSISLPSTTTNNTTILDLQDNGSTVLKFGNSTIDQSVDYVWTATNSVLDIVSSWSNEGGRLLFEDGYFRIGYSSGTNWDAYLEYDIDGNGDWKLNQPASFTADYSGNAAITNRSIMDKGYIDGVGFSTRTLTSDININGAETYDIRFGADSSGTTGNSFRIDTFGVYGENLVTFEAGDQGGDRYSIAMLSGLGLMQLGAFNSSSQLTGFQWGTNDMSLYYQGSEYIDFTTTEMVFKVDIATQDDTNWFLTGDDLKFYDGTSDTSTNNLTIHGDGNHSIFNPYVTLHEGFATNNGTNAQSLIMNIGKAARLQWNDGTRSVDLFHIEAVVNAAETVTHMETSFQSVLHYYTEIDNFQWYFDTSGTTNTWSIFDDDAGTNEIFTFDDSGNLTISGNLSASNVFDSVPSMFAGTTIQTATTTETQISLDVIDYDESGSEYTISTTSNNVTFNNADGTKLYSVTFKGLIDLNTNLGDTRSYARIKARYGGTTDINRSETWEYIREFQGGTNGKPNTQISNPEFYIRPTAGQVMDFVFWGTTDGGTLTDFDLTEFTVTIKRIK